MLKFLFQSGDFCTSEKRAIRWVIEPDEVIYAGFEDLENFTKNNKTPLIPVGTVEFTTKYMQKMGIKQPDYLSYPMALQPFLRRMIRVSTYGAANDGEFVKPFELVKEFNGHIKGEGTETPPSDDTLCWVCEQVEWLAEWRYYIIDGQIAGVSRYDDGEEKLTNTMAWTMDALVRDCISAWKDIPAGCSIDVGIIKTGPGQAMPALVECNDGWALGYYPWGTATPSVYKDLISKRWNQICPTQSESRSLIPYERKSSQA